MEQENLAISILGVGSCVPSIRLTNKDLESMVDTSDSWITQRTGIKERRISAKKENVYVLTALAAQRALEDAGVREDEIDAIYVGTNSTGEFLVPGVSHIVQYLINAKKSSACDISAGCSGSLYAIENSIGKILLEYRFTGKKETKILALAGDTLSAVTNYNDRDTCVLLSDAAAGVVLGIQDEPGIYSIHTKSQGEDGHTITYKSIFELPTITQTENGIKLSHKGKIKRTEKTFKMNGQPVFKFAVRALEKVVKMCIDTAGFKLNDIKDELKLIPHQANLIILEKAAQRLGLPMEHVYHNGIVNYGNSSAASLFVELDHAYRNNELKKDDLVCLAAFGAGLTYAGTLLKWNKEFTGEKYNKIQQEQEINLLYDKYQKWKSNI